MASTTPTLRSLSDLKSLFPTESRPPRIFRQAALPVGVKRPASGPFIPCSLCGMSLKYSLAVARVIDDEQGFAGYTHPVGQCDPQTVREWRARVAVIADRTLAIMASKARRAGSG